MSEITQFIITIIIVIISIIIIIIIITPRRNVRARLRTECARALAPTLAFRRRRRTPRAPFRTGSAQRAPAPTHAARSAASARPPADAAPARADVDGRSVTPALTQRPCASADGSRRRRALR